MKFRAAAFLAAMLALAAPLSAAPLSFVAYLDGTSEAPPNASPGTGVALAIIDPVAHTMQVSAVFSGSLGDVTAAHIHVISGQGDANPAGTLGPVATTTSTFAGFPAGVTAGNYLNTLDMTLASSYRPGWIADSGGTPAAAEFALFDAIEDSRAYFNTHSKVFQAVKSAASCSPFPIREPWLSPERRLPLCFGPGGAPNASPPSSRSSARRGGRQASPLRLALPDTAAAASEFLAPAPSSLPGAACREARWRSSLRP